MPNANSPLNAGNLADTIRLAAQQRRITPTDPNNIDGAFGARNNSTGFSPNVTKLDAKSSGQGTIGGGGNSGKDFGGGNTGSVSDPNNAVVGGGTGGACFRMDMKTEGKIIKTIIHYGLFTLRKLIFDNGDYSDLYVTSKHRLYCYLHGWEAAGKVKANLCRFRGNNGVAWLVENSFGGVTWKVFNHETEDHVFYANGLLVHNTKSV